MNIKKTCYLLGSLLLTVSLISCDNQTPYATSPSQTAAPRAEIMPPPTIVTPTIRLSGKVLEVFNSVPYTFVKLITADGERWVATVTTEIAVGDIVSFAGGQVMENFHSASLNRTFPAIIFSSGIISREMASAPIMDNSTFADAVQTVKQTVQAGNDLTMDQAVPAGSAKAVVALVDITVAKAVGANARTVSDIYNNAAELNGKKIMVQGQVVKFSPNIMGRNWLHLQDGSGDPAQGTHNLVVTSTSPVMPVKGDIVVVEGIMATNKDFGFGYQYIVIIEDAEIKLQTSPVSY